MSQWALWISCVGSDCCSWLSSQPRCLHIGHSLQMLALKPMQFQKQFSKANLCFKVMVNVVNFRSTGHSMSFKSSGLKSGLVVDPGQQNFDFSRQISEKFRFFQAISWKFSIFPGKFVKNFNFSGKFSIFFTQFFKKFDFPGKIAHLQLLLSKLLYISLQKSQLSNILPAHDNI